MSEKDHSGHQPHGHQHGQDGPAGQGGHDHPPPGRPGGKPGFDLDEALKKQPRWLQEEISEIRKHERKVLRALEDPETRERFVTDPARVLRDLKVPMSGAFRQRLRADQSVRDLKTGVCFKLPNGQAITPRMRFKFTK